MAKKKAVRKAPPRKALKKLVRGDESDTKATKTPQIPEGDVWPHEEITFGEVCDRHNILMMKMEHAASRQRQNAVRKELQAIEKKFLGDCDPIRFVRASRLPRLSEVVRWPSPFFSSPDEHVISQLYALNDINKQLWDCEDDIRLLLRANDRVSRAIDRLIWCDRLLYSTPADLMMLNELQFDGPVSKGNPEVTADLRAELADLVDLFNDAVMLLTEDKEASQHLLARLAKRIACLNDRRTEIKNFLSLAYVETEPSTITVSSTADKIYS